MAWTRYRNYALNVWERGSRRLVLRSRPYRVYIDPINICSLRCPLCPTGQRHMPSQGRMSLQHSRRIFDEIGGHAAWVGLYNWGEPLLHDDLPAMIRYVAESHVRTVVSTHFNVAFSTQDARDLIRAGLSRLIVSVDGATAETYGIYRIGGDFTVVMANLRTLAEARRSLGTATPEIVIQFIPFRHNEHELGAMHALARGMGARLSVVPATCDMGRALETTPDEAVCCCGEWLPANPALRRYDAAGGWVRTTAVCESLWNTVVVRWDGEIYPCCLPYGDEHSLGNVLAAPFESIWNGAQMQHARALFVGADSVDAVAPAACDLCYAHRGWDAQDLPPAGLHSVWRACTNAADRRISLWRERLGRWLR